MRVKTIAGTHRSWRDRKTPPPTPLLTRGEYWIYFWEDGPKARFDTNNYLRREIPHGAVSWPLDITSVIKHGVTDGARKRDYKIDAAILVMSKGKGLLRLFPQEDPTLSFGTTFPNEVDAVWNIYRNDRIIDVCSLAGRIR